MKQESVAILDIGSGEVTFALGTKGVNGTFVFKDSHSEGYEGYFTDGFLEEASFRRAVETSVNAVRQNYDGKLDKVCVGVPAPFVAVRTKGHTISFPSKRKITMQDVEALYDSGQNELFARGKCIYRSAMYFSLGDNRTYFTPESVCGASSNLVKGALCYYYISEELFAMLTELLEGVGFQSIRFAPVTQAQASYLLSEKQREGYAFLLDVGFLTTSISVVYGNGIVHEQSFDCGVGTVQVALMRELDVDYPLAVEILENANVSGGALDKELVWTAESGAQFSVEKINDVIKCALDTICEGIEDFFHRHYEDRQAIAFTSNPLSVTGEGCTRIRGAAEHFSKRLNRLTEIVCPDLPYFDKPSFSSRISLLSEAAKKEKKPSLLQRLFGGR